MTFETLCRRRKFRSTKQSKTQAKHEQNEQHMDQELREAFSLFDRNGDGKLTRDELKKTLEVIGCLSTAEIEQELKKACNGRDECEFANFLALMSRLLKDDAQTDDLLEAFRVYDKNNNGFISGHELRRILEGDKMKKEDVDELLKDMGVDEEGDIDYESFVKKLKK